MTNAVDAVWEAELEEVLRSAGRNLKWFAEAAEVYAALDVATREAVDRVATRAALAEITVHPNQAAICILGSSSMHGPAAFAALLAQMRDDVPESWISRADPRSSNLTSSFVRVGAVMRSLARPTPSSFEAALAEVERVPDLHFRELGSRLLELYRALGLADARALCDRAWDLPASEPSLQGECEAILVRTSAVVPGALDGRHEALLDAGVLYPAWLFAGADSATRDRLIEALESEVEEGMSSPILSALAWIGGDLVAHQLLRWSASADAPSWRSELHVLPLTYAEDAGWSVTEAGKCRSLVGEDCRVLLTESTGSHPLTLFAPAGESCPGCNGPLSYAIDLGRAELAFLKIDGARLRILTCEHCTAFGSIHCEVTLDGAARWWNGNPSQLPEREPSAPIGTCEAWLGPSVAPTEALARIAGDQSQLGGHPTWENDAWYPPCPACAKPMPCIGQLAIADFDEGEGFIYLYLDVTCGFAATTFQQT